MEKMQHRSRQIPERQGVNSRRDRKEEGGAEQLFFPVHRVSQQNAAPPVRGVVTALPRLHRSHGYDYSLLQIEGWRGGGAEGERQEME